MSKIVARTLDFLELFAEERQPLALSDISRLLKIPLSSCHDVLQTLLERGFIYEIAPRGGYYPTRRLLDLSQTITQHDPVLLRAEVALRALRDTVDDSVLLSKSTGTGATYLLSFEPSHPLRFTVAVGERVRSLYATSGGRAQLAAWPDAELDNFLRTATLKPLTSRTITDREALRREIDAGRRRGWFANIEESQEGVITLSASFNWNGATYIVTIAGPTSRLTGRVEWAAAHLTEACAKLSMRPALGGAMA